MNDAPLDKQALRRAARSARQALGPHPPIIAPPPPFTALLAPGMIVASYVPVGSEADPTGFAACCAVRAPRAGAGETLPSSFPRTPRAIRPVPAPTVVIEPGLFGAWNLRVAGYNASARVRRVR